MSIRRCTLRMVLVSVIRLALFLALTTGMARAEDRHVSDAKGLTATLDDEFSGVIVLAPGDYGDLSIFGRNRGRTVTLRAAEPRTAVFTGIRLKKVGNMAFEGLHTRGQFRVEQSHDVAISDCLADDMLYFRNVDGIKISNCDVGGGKFGVLFNTVQNFEISHTRLGRVTEDVMRITGDSRNGLVEYNFFDDVIAVPPTHPDLIQFFSARGKTPQHITIRRNLFYDDPDTGPKRTAQGIFVAGPGTEGFRDLLVEENLITTRSVNTIFVNGGVSNVVVRNNTLLASRGGGAIIRLAQGKILDNSGVTVTGNTAKLLLDKTKVASIGPNYFYGRKASLERLFSGPGGRWQDYLPVINSTAERSGMGAAKFLKALVEGQKDGSIHIGPDWLR